MKKYFFVLIGFLLVNSAYAYLDENSTCTSSTMNAASGNISLEAVEVPNVINIQWENADGTTYTTSTCTYDTQLQIPNAPAARSGYTFKGWTLEEACSLSNLDTSIDADRNACLDLNGNGVCIDSVNNGVVANASLYGLDTPGQWAVSFSYGTVFGMAKCSAKNGDNHGKVWGGNSADWTSDATTLDSTTGDARYCWCRATGYIANGAEQCSLSSPAWVFSGDEYSAADCAKVCAYNCGSAVRYVPGFRAALFGVAQ